jgi:hypothetical protein
MKTGAINVALALMLCVSAGGQPSLTENIVFERPQPSVIEPTGRVARSVGQLADSRPEKRHAAAQRLLKIGPAILPQLRGALRHEPPWPTQDFTVIPGTLSFRLDPSWLLSRERQNELEVLISHLEEQRHLKASVITLHCKDTPIIDVLPDLGSQVEAEVWFASWYNLVALDYLKTNRVTLDLDRAGYWETLQVLMRRAGLGTMSPNGQNRLVFVKAAQRSPPGSSEPALNKLSAVCGTFQIAAQAPELGQSPESQDAKPAVVMKLSLSAQAEPKLGALGTCARVRLDRCLDDKGQSLLLEGKDTFYSAENPVGAHWTVPIELAGLRPARRIKTLKGELAVAIGPRQRDLAIIDLLQAQGYSREFDSLTITVERVTQTTGRYEVDVALSAQAGSPYALTFSGSALPDIQLWDASRQSLERCREVFLAPRGMYHERGQDVTAWRLSCTRPPATLTWLTPAETRWVRVPFELR